MTTTTTGPSRQAPGQLPDLDGGELQVAKPAEPWMVRGAEAAVGPVNVPTVVAPDTIAALEGGRGLLGEFSTQLQEAIPAQLPGSGGEAGEAAKLPAAGDQPAVQGGPGVLGEFSTLMQEAEVAHEGENSKLTAEMCWQLCTRNHELEQEVKALKEANIALQPHATAYEEAGDIDLRGPENVHANKLPGAGSEAAKAAKGPAAGGQQPALEGVLNLPVPATQPHEGTTAQRIKELEDALQAQADTSQQRIKELEEKINALQAQVFFNPEKVERLKQYMAALQAQADNHLPVSQAPAEVNGFLFIYDKMMSRRWTYPLKLYYQDSTQQYRANVYYSEELAVARLKGQQPEPAAEAAAALALAAEAAAAAPDQEASDADSAADSSRSAASESDSSSSSEDEEAAEADEGAVAVAAVPAEEEQQQPAEEEAEGQLYDEASYMSMG